MNYKNIDYNRYLKSVFPKAEETFLLDLLLGYVSKFEEETDLNNNEPFIFLCIGRITM